MALKKWLLLVTVFVGSIVLFQSCGASDDTEDDDTEDADKTNSDPVASSEWADVRPIITESCGGGTNSCHNSTSFNSYDWSSPTEATFAKTSSDYAAFKRRLDAKDMPPDGSGITLSAADRRVLEGYFK